MRSADQRRVDVRLATQRPAPRRQRRVTSTTAGGTERTAGARHRPVTRRPRRETPATRHATATGDSRRPRDDRRAGDRARLQLGAGHQRAAARTLQQGGELRMPVGLAGARTGTRTTQRQRRRLRRHSRADGSPRLFDFDADGWPRRTPTTCSTFTVDEDRRRPSPTSSTRRRSGTTVPDRRRRLRRHLAGPESTRTTSRRDRGLRPDRRRSSRAPTSSRSIVTFKTVYPDYQACSTRCSRPRRRRHRDRSTTAGTARSTLTGSPARSPSVPTTPPRASSSESRTRDWWGDKPLLDKIIFRVVAARPCRRRTPTASSTPSTSAPTRTASRSPSETAGGTRSAAAAGPNWRHITLNITAGLIADQDDPSGDRAVASTAPNRLVRPRRHPVAGEAARQPHLRREPGRLRRQRRRVQTVRPATEAPWRSRGGRLARRRRYPREGRPAADGQVHAARRRSGVGERGQLSEPAQPTSASRSRSSTCRSSDFGAGARRRRLRDDRVHLARHAVPVPGIQQLYGTGSESNFAKSDSLRSTSCCVEQIAVETDVRPSPRPAGEPGGRAPVWDYVNLPLYQRPDLSGNVLKLANWGSFGLASPRYQNVGFTK